MFSVNISQEDMAKESEKYINNINSAITTDTKPALDAYNNAFNATLDEFVNYLDVDKYLASKSLNDRVNKLALDYYIPADTYKTIYKGILTGVLTGYNTAMQNIPAEMKDAMKSQVYNGIVNTIKDQAEIRAAASQMATTMTETKCPSIFLIIEFITREYIYISLILLFLNYV